MHRFTISWVSFFDNVLHIEECYAISYKQALEYILIKKLGYTISSVEYKDYTAEDLKVLAFDSDCLIEALQTHGE